MANNTADEAGDSVYGLDFGICFTEATFWSIYNIAGRKSSDYDITSEPVRICLCSPDISPKKYCKEDVTINTYPGQTFNVSVVCTGLYNYTAPCWRKNPREIC